MSEEKRVFSILGVPSLRGPMNLKRAARASLVGLAVGYRLMPSSRKRKSNLGVITPMRGRFNLPEGFLALIVCISISLSSSLAAADTFKPIRERLVFSSDMTPIDIEVVGSTSQVAQFHKLIPELVVRFRLARAYVELYAEREPGFELLSLGVDLETALPMALFLAVLGGPRLGKEIPGIPKLPPEEARRRNILLSIHSDLRAEYLRKFGDVLAGCRGQAVENDLWVYVRKDNCPGLGPQRFGRIGQLEDALLSKIECDEVLPSSVARCEVRFPFEGFSVGVNFDRDLLPRWREMIGFSKTFLKSKQYQPIE